MPEDMIMTAVNPRLNKKMWRAVECRKRLRKLGDGYLKDADMFFAFLHLEF
jgi:hypothetical protein